MEFLSFKAIERRMLQGISIDESDLPVNPIYIQALKDKGVDIYNVSKWINAVSVSTDDQTVIETIKSLPFVLAVKPVISMIDPSRGITKEKFEPIISVDFPAFTTTRYGATLNQINFSNEHWFTKCFTQSFSLSHCIKRIALMLSNNFSIFIHKITTAHCIFQFRLSSF